MKATNADVIEMLKGIGTLTINPNELVASMPFKEQKIDSLDVMSIVLGLEDKFGLKVPDEDFGKLTSIERTVEYLNARLNSK